MKIIIASILIVSSCGGSRDNNDTTTNSLSAATKDKLCLDKGGIPRGDRFMYNGCDFPCR